MNIHDTLRHASVEQMTRRFFFKTSTACIGGIALRSLLGSQSIAATPKLTLAAKAKRVIYIHLAGAPSQLETFD